jgi:hypothetical protein
MHLFDLGAYMMIFRVLAGTGTGTGTGGSQTRAAIASRG